MNIFALLLASCLTITNAVPQQRIAGGVAALLGEHPYATAVLYGQDYINFRLVCGGAILNNRTVMTATSCVINANVHQIRLRVGSINANAGGSVLGTGSMIIHPNYDVWNRQNNIALLRVASPYLPLGVNVRPTQIAGTNYAIHDYQYVSAIGWGQTIAGGVLSDVLRRAQVMTVNQARCQNIHGLNFITLNMLCAGWEITPRGACAADMGSPLLHNNVVVGVTSYVIGCGDINFPAVYTRIPRYATWIINNS